MKLPNNVLTYQKELMRPETRGDKKVRDFESMFSILTLKEAADILDKMRIKKDTTFYNYYLNFLPSGAHFRGDSDLLYDLDEIYEDYKQPFWSRYKEIGERYLQLSSIEGEWSYFYDKETDAVYGVDWSEMDDFINGKLEPLFNSFYDFLEWYYSDDNEE